jgi:hypothetical protein
MATELLTERYAEQIVGVVACYDRIVINGNLSPLCYAQGMTKYLYQQGIRIFDYTGFAEPLREQIRAHAEEVAAAAGIAIEFVTQDLRKEEHIQSLLEKRGMSLAWCISSRPWKAVRRTSPGTTNRQDLCATNDGQVPALLFLFH